MSTAAKTPAKRVQKAVSEPVAEYRMPTEVADWIKRAEARIAFMTTQIEDLKDANAKLRKANRVMEARVLGQSQE
jgi:capsule polysaccharide export protein KpsE/RkpR